MAQCGRVLAVLAGSRRVAARKTQTLAFSFFSIAHGATTHSTAALVAALAAGSVTISFAVAAAKDEPFSPGQAIGEGLKGDLWKAKHPNVQILELEEGPFMPLLSHVRNVETAGAAFVNFAERAMRLLLEAAFTELPNDDGAEFLTPCGVTMQGAQLEDGAEVIAISLVADGESPGLWDRPLRHTFPGAATGTIHHKNFQAGPVRFKGGAGTAAGGYGGGKDAGDDGKDSGGSGGEKASQTILLLAPVVASAEYVLSALASLAEAGVEEEDVVLVSLVVSMAACDKLSKEAKKLRLIAGAVDPALDAAGAVVPGAGDVVARYFSALKESRQDSAGDLAPAGRRRWLWFF